jgi:hypothetical protein
MKKILAMAPLCLITAACGNAKKIVDIDPLLQPYVDRFVKYAAEAGNPLIAGKPVTVDNLIANIQVEPASVGWVGQCAYLQTPTITFNKAYWDIYDDTMREATMLHELGHCVLMRGHNNDTYTDPLTGTTVPVSIMFWLVPYSDAEYYMYKGNWILELFWYGGPSEDAAQPGTTIN